MEMPGFWDNPAASRAAPAEAPRSSSARLETLNRLRADADELETWRELSGEGRGRPRRRRASSNGSTPSSRSSSSSSSSPGPDDDKNAHPRHPLRAPAAPSRRTGPRCSCACTCAGREQHGYGVELHRPAGRRRGRDQERHLRRARRQRLRLPEGRERRPPPGADQPVRLRRRGATPRSPRSTSTPRSTTPSRSRSTTRTCASTPTAPRAPAASTSTRPTRRCASRTCRPASWSACQNERSQIKNRAHGDEDPARRASTTSSCKKRAAEQAKREGEKMDIAWGSQIRSYVLQPYRMVKDHRTGRSVGDTDRCSTATSTRSSRPGSRDRSPAPAKPATTSDPNQGIAVQPSRPDAVRISAEPPE